MKDDSEWFLINPSSFIFNPFGRGRGTRQSPSAAAPPPLATRPSAGAGHTESPGGKGPRRRHTPGSSSDDFRPSADGPGAARAPPNRRATDPFRGRSFGAHT